MARTLKVGQSVLITSMGRTDSVGVIRKMEPFGRLVVRLPNWQADGVHLDVACRDYEVETGHGRAERCHCVYCG